MLVGALRAFVNTHYLRIAVSEFGSGCGCGAGSAAALPPVVQNELVTITPVLLQAAVSEYQVGARDLMCGTLSTELDRTTVASLGIDGHIAHSVDSSVWQDPFMFAVHMSCQMQTCGRRRYSTST